MVQVIRKAVLPVAGLGTRFLPATKVIPKEMLPIVDKPLIQYAVEEAINAGITEFILVTRQDKKSIEDHFKRADALEQELNAKGKQDLLDSVNSLLRDDISWKSVLQTIPLGLGHAVLCARDIVGHESFAVLLPDDLIDNDSQGCLKQMTDVYAKYQCSVVAVENVPLNETDRYGIVNTKPFNKSVSKVTGIIEKPKPEAAPSTLAVVGRYILSPVIFEMLDQIGKGAGDEIQLTDAIAMLLLKEQVLAYEFDGKRYDCGTKLGYLQANVEYGLKHPVLHSDFSKYIASLK